MKQGGLVWPMEFWKMVQGALGFETLQTSSCSHLAKFVLPILLEKSVF
jgi:hypothetical protein